MITKLIQFLITALVCLIVFWIIGWFISGVILKVVGIILALCLIVYALRLFGIAVMMAFAFIPLTGCHVLPKKAGNVPAENFGKPEEKFDELAKTISAVRKSNLTIDEKVALISEKVKELEDLEESQ